MAKFKLVAGYHVQDDGCDFLFQEEVHLQEIIVASTYGEALVTAKSILDNYDYDFSYVTEYTDGDEALELLQTTVNLYLNAKLNKLDMATELQSIMSQAYNLLNKE